MANFIAEDAPMNRPNAPRVFLVLSAAFALHAIALFVVLPTLIGHFSLQYNLGFQDGYDQIARNLDRGLGYKFQGDMGETMLREPGYPLFLAAVFRIGGYRIEAVRLANLFLLAGSALMLLHLSRKAVGEGVTPLCVTLLFLLLPGTFVSEARGGIELAFITSVLAFMVVLHWAISKGGHWRYLLAGIALGAAVQVRSTPLFFPFVIFLYLMIASKGKAQRFRAITDVALVALGMIVVMIPWIVRNYRLTGEFVPTGTVVGTTAHEGQYICQHYSITRDFYRAEQEAGFARSALATQLGLRYEGIEYYQVFRDPRDEVKFSRALLKRVADGYRENPGFFAGCVAKNTLYFWFLGKTWTATQLNVLVQAPLLLLALGGAWLLWRQGLLQRSGLMLTFAIYIMAVDIPITGYARHSVPTTPFLAIPAGFAIVSTWQNWRKTRNEPTNCS